VALITVRLASEPIGEYPIGQLQPIGEYERTKISSLPSFDRTLLWATALTVKSYVYIAYSIASSGIIKSDWDALRVCLWV